jgi:ribosomal protein S18 acetylase RimI-like enzyme
VKVHYDIPMHGEISRDDKNFIQGRVWLDSKTISFWEKRRDVLEYFNMVEELLSALKLDKKHVLYDFIDEYELLTYDELETNGLSNKDHDEIKRLMAVQHFDPEAKKKLAVMMGNMKQKGNTGFDFQAQRDAQMPALQEIYGMNSVSKKRSAQSMFNRLAPKNSHWQMDISSMIGSPDALEISSFRVDKKYRGKGLGTQIIRALCKAADHYGLAIEVEPGGEDAIAGRLVPWYQRHGFVWKDGYMRREPNTST